MVLKTDISNLCIKCVVLTSNRTNITLSSAVSLKYHQFNGCNSYNKSKQAGAQINQRHSEQIIQSSLRIKQS